LFEIFLPSIVLALLVVIHHFSIAEDFKTDLHLEWKSDWNTAKYTGALLARLNAYRTAIAVVPKEEFPEMIDFFNHVITPAADQVRFNLTHLPDSLLMTFDSIEEMNAYLDDPDYGRVDEKPQLNTILQSKQLYHKDELPPIPHFEYHIRLNASGSVESPSQQTVPDTRIAPVDIVQPGFEAEQWAKYAGDGFQFFQQIQDLFILNRTGAVYIRPWELGGAFDLDRVVQASFLPFPTKAFKADTFFRSIGETIGLFFTITFIWSVTRIVASLIEEKELKLREGMKIMGLQSKWLILSWICTYLIVFLLTCLSIAAAIGPFLFPESNKIILFTFFFTFCCSTFSFGYLMSTIFDKSNVGSAFSAIIFLVIYFANEVVKQPGTQRAAKLIASISPAVALSQGAAAFGQYESQGVGITIGRLFEQYDGYSVGDAIGMLLFDTFYLFLLGSYLEKVLPGEYGITKPWYFPLVCCCSGKKTREESRGLLEEDIYDTLPPNEVYTKVQQPSQNDIGNEGIKIRKLRRTFQRDKKEPFIAVHELSLDIYKNQVFVLLGHNGAGKSTTINMLTGLIGTTSGNVQILGRELDTELAAIRQNMGYCPQHDLLYPTLSVREHLELYADIKGATTDEDLREKMILDIIDEVGLAKDNKEHALSMTLSGGQKRKLSVAIALLNNSPIVLLDEPSSGMDVAAQRDLWKLIQSSKKNRVVLLTTHSMEEAEIGDRIAILAHSRLQCVGTSHYLKNAYGVGYTLTVTKQAQGKESNQTNNFGEATKLHKDCTTRTGSAIASYLLPKYPFLSISSDAGMEIGFKVRFEESHLFPGLFDDLENNKDRLQIVSYGMSVTTLTEVFLTVGHGQEFIEGVHDRKQLTEVDDEKPEFDSSSSSIDYSTSSLDQLTHVHNSLNSSSSDKPEEDEKYSLEDIYGSASSSRRQDHVRSGLDLFTAHFKAMFKKRYANSKRDLKAWVWQLLFPGILLTVSLLMVKLTNVDEYPVRSMNPSLYYDDYKGYTPYSTPSTVAAEDFLKNFAYTTPIFIPEAALPEPIKMITNTSFFMQSVTDGGGFEEKNQVTPFDFMDIIGQFRALNDLFYHSYVNAINPQGPTAEAQLKQIEKVKFDQSLSENELLSDEIDNFTHHNDLDIGIDPSHNQNGKKLTSFDTFLTIVNNLQDYINLMDENSLTPVNNIQTNVDIDNPVPLDRFHTWLLQEGWKGQYRFLAYTINKINLDPNILDNVSFNGTIHFNTTARDALPVGVNSLSNALLSARYKKVHPNAAGTEVPTITVVNNPLPRTENEKLFVSSTVGIFIALSMAFVPSTFVGFLVKERFEKAKHLQIISGVSPLAYWVSTYAWDTLNFVFPFVLSMVILFLYDMQALISPKVVMYTVLAFWLFQLSVAPFVYCFSFFFDSHNAAQNLTLLLGFFLSVILLIASLIMSQLPSTGPSDRYLRWLYRFFPPFSFGEALITITLQNSGFNPDALWKPLAFMFFSAIFYFCLLLILEAMTTDHSLVAFTRRLKSFLTRNIPCLRPTTRGNALTSLPVLDEEEIPIENIQNEEQDVIDERNRILYGECDNPEYGVVLKGLRKVYSSRAGQPPHVAVNNLYFAIPYGQCFGLLGANGAGKSTTMKMITGDETPSPQSGSALLGGFDLMQQSSRVRQVLGYCPQFDALLPLLTAREHLELYARIKCVPTQYIKGLVNYMIDKLGLTHLQNNPAGTYSGGNKRKLSIGIALIGQPLALLLDEPSSGVDPASRREIWRLISSTMKGRAVILVSHSMEECEALCQRIGIMTSGNLRAINSAQQLKSKYGDGYQIITKSKDGQEDTLMDFFNNAYKGVEIVEQHGVNFTLKIPKIQNNIALTFKDVFSVIENNKTSAGIESYSVSDTDLEHIFIGFVEEDHRRRREHQKAMELAAEQAANGGVPSNLNDLAFMGSPDGGI
jgi:ABC-type multidrug transport system ATPase subunit